MTIMAVLNLEYLQQLEEYLKSGYYQEDFFFSEEERRLEMLGFLEKLMELGELADEVATKIIFRKRDPL